MPSGEKRHYLLDDEGFEKIKESLKVFLPDWELKDKDDLWNWLSTIDIYSDWLK